VPVAAAAAKAAVTMPIASRIDSALRQPQAPTSYPTTPPPQSSASNRGLYMGLGALVLVVVLAAAGFYLPKFKRASAAEGTPASQPAAASQPKAEASTPISQPTAATTATQPQAETQAPNSSHPVEVAKSNRGATQKKEATIATLPPGTYTAPAPPAVDTAALNEVETEVDQLTTRAAAVDTGLSNLQRQQAASGLGLRGDMAEKQAAMRLNIAKAQDAVRNKDVDRAKKYSAVANANIEALEKFLGR
jgi:cytoskeletal protein RodZ